MMSLIQDTPNLVNDSILDCLDGQTLKLLDKHELLCNGGNKIALFPYSHFRHLGVSHEMIRKCKMSISSPGFETALEVFNHTEKYETVKFNVKSLDDVTSGIDVGVVTEIFGEGGSGKTQLCLQLALHCLLSGGAVVYISTDKHFPIHRLDVMVDCLLVKKGDNKNILDNMFFGEFNKPADLRNAVFKMLPLFLKVHNIKLIIIDSIAGIFRMEENYIKRAHDMRKIVMELERLSDIYNFAIVTTNHVTSVPKFDGTEKQIPSLGPTWDSLVTTKLKVEKTEEFTNTKSSKDVSRVRLLKVVHSPKLPYQQAKFIVGNSGILSVDCLKRKHNI